MSEKTTHTVTLSDGKTYDVSGIKMPEGWRSHEIDDSAPPIEFQQIVPGARFQSRRQGGPVATVTRVTHSLVYYAIDGDEVPGREFFSCGMPHFVAQYSLITEE